MYSSDYDEKLPFGIPSGLVAGQAGWPQTSLGAPAALGTCNWEYSCGWAFASQAYIKNTQVLLCPNYNRVQFAGPNGSRFWWATTYELSSCLVGASEAEISNAATKVMLYDILPYHYDGTVVAAPAPAFANPLHGFYNNNPKPNMNEIVAFADGHTKVMNTNQAMGPLVACGPSNNGANGIPGINGETRGTANKWNLNVGWDPASGPNFTCGAAVNNSPFGLTGRDGANF